MPLVLIHVVEGRRTTEQLRRVADTIHAAILAHFDAPPRDRYQIITEHRPGQIIAEDTNLGFVRTEDLVFIRIVQQGRTIEQKQELYKHLADTLESETGLAPTDLIISITANSPEDWSFGMGEAQFITGKL